MTKLLRIAALLLATTSAAIVQAAEPIGVTGAWTRALPPVTRTAAAYFQIVNNAARPDRLLGASTPVAARAEVHTHTMDGGMMRMRQVPDVVLLPGEAVRFEPHGLHVMLFDLREPLGVGRRYPLTLRFEHAAPLEVEVTVRREPPP